MKYLDYDGLQRYDSKLKDYIDNHIPTKSSSVVDARNSNNTIKFALCTQAEYDELGNNYEQNVVYIITDDEASLYTVIANPQTTTDDIYTITVGTTNYAIKDARVDDILDGTNVDSFADVEDLFATDLEVQNMLSEVFD